MKSLLIANRGEIALRIMRTCRDMGIATVAVYSTADAGAAHVGRADVAIALSGPPELAYLDCEAIVAAATSGGAEWVHPGYGFLAEDPRLAEAVAAAGLVFVGPPASVIATMADKLEARRVAAGAGLPVVPGGTVDGAIPTFPVLVKAAAGGGGRAMVRVDSIDDLAGAVAAASRQAESLFRDPRIYVEELIPSARHIEVQVLADDHGGVVHVHDRECTVQRRYQKVIEEAPAPRLDPALRAELADSACRLAKAVGYLGAGTVEFLVDPDGRWWFLEMNTRLQVEHTVTEAITGIDLVAAQISIARGGRVPAQADVPAPGGHAVEARLLAEDPSRSDVPQTGTLHTFEVPDHPDVRVDSGVDTGSTVTAHYDPLLAKVIASAPERPAAIALLATTLRRSRVHGVATNRDLLVRVLTHPDFVTGDVDTAWLTTVATEIRRPLLPPQHVAPAAAAAALVTASEGWASTKVMPSIPAGFRTVPGDPAVRRYEVGSEVVEVAYRLHPAMEAIVGGSWYRAVAVQDGRVELDVDSAHRVYEVTPWPGGALHRITVDSAEGAVDLVEVPRFGSPSAPAPAGSLAAPVPGRVTAVAVTRGTEVDAGHRLVVIESMKLEHTVAAVEPGVVTEVVAVGDTVAAGQVVATVSPRATGEQVGDRPDPGSATIP